MKKKIIKSEKITRSKKNISKELSSEKNEVTNFSGNNKSKSKKIISFNNCNCKLKS